MARYDKYGRQKVLDWPLIIACSVTGLLVAGLVAFVVHAINETDKADAAFEAKCKAAGGSVMWTRDADFCLNGNTILFMNN